MQAAYFPAQGTEIWIIDDDKQPSRGSFANSHWPCCVCCSFTSLFVTSFLCCSFFSFTPISIPPTLVPYQEPRRLGWWPPTPLLMNPLTHMPANVHPRRGSTTSRHTAHPKSLLDGDRCAPPHRDKVGNHFVPGSVHSAGGRRRGPPAALQACPFWSIASLTFPVVVWNLPVHSWSVTPEPDSGVWGQGGRAQDYPVEYPYYPVEYPYLPCGVPPTTLMGQPRNARGGKGTAVEAHLSPTAHPLLACRTR